MNITLRWVHVIVKGGLRTLYWGLPSLGDYTVLTSTPFGANPGTPPLQGFPVMWLGSLIFFTPGASESDESAPSGV